MDAYRLPLLLMPIIAVQLGVVILAITGMKNPEQRVRGHGKLTWTFVVILVDLFIVLLYFTLFGRN